MFAHFYTLAAITEPRAAFFERIYKIKLRTNHFNAFLVDKPHFAVLDKTQQSFLHIIRAVVKQERYVDDLALPVNCLPTVAGDNVGDAVVIEIDFTEGFAVIRGNIFFAK